MSSTSCFLFGDCAGEHPFRLESDPKILEGQDGWGRLVFYPRPLVLLGLEGYCFFG